jgi:predicted GIY-YIG superfamily endonuclease
LGTAIDGYGYYEYSDFVNDRGDSLEFDSYLIPTERNQGDLPPKPNNPDDLPRSLTFTNLHEPETREAARKALAGKAGVYCIRCLLDGKCYVGSAVNLYDRLCEHLYRNGSISNLHLQAAITKHGLENFEFRRRLRQMSAAAAAVCY